jgi:hypothetical protein
VEGWVIVPVQQLVKYLPALWLGSRLAASQYIMGLVAAVCQEVVVVVVPLVAVVVAPAVDAAGRRSLFQFLICL